MFNAGGQLVITHEPMKGAHNSIASLKCYRTSKLDIKFTAVSAPWHQIPLIFCSVSDIRIILDELEKKIEY